MSERTPERRSASPERWEPLDLEETDETSVVEDERRRIQINV
jgi:hypothetical protein